MKRLSLLAGVLVLLAACAGYLFKQGYWDTWADKKAELKAELLASFQGVPDSVADSLADCVAEAGLAAAEQLGCKPAKGPVKEQITECISAAGPEINLGVQMAVMTCVMEAQSKL